MWVWRCPNNPELKNEHHSAHMARTAIVRHALHGAPDLGIPPCRASHEISDDEVPCSKEKDGCKIPYIQETSANG